MKPTEGAYRYELWIGTRYWVRWSDGARGLDDTRARKLLARWLRRYARNGTRDSFGALYVSIARIWAPNWIVPAINRWPEIEHFEADPDAVREFVRVYAPNK